MNETLKLNKKSITKFWDIVNEHNNFILCLHVDADADSLGSNIAMRELLTQMGKKVTLLAGKNESFSKDLRDLDGWLSTVSNHGVDYLHLDVMESTCFIMIDTSNEDRLHDVKIPSNIHKIVFDHHASNNITGALLSIIDSDFSSASQMVWELAVEKSGLHTDDFCKAVFMGIYGDTGGFKHGISDRVFEIASIIQRRVNIEPLINAYNNSVGYDDMAMLSIATNHLEFFNVGRLRFCMTTISKDEIAKHHEIGKETNSNFVVRVLEQQKDIDVLVVANQDTEDRWRVRFRSFGQNDYAKAMAEIVSGGGGHPNAASGTIVTNNYRTVSAMIKANAIKIFGS